MVQIAIMITGAHRSQQMLRTLDGADGGSEREREDAMGPWTKFSMFADGSKKDNKFRI